MDVNNPLKVVLIGIDPYLYINIGDINYKDGMWMTRTVIDLQEMDMSGPSSGFHAKGSQIHWGIGGRWMGTCAMSGTV